MGDNTGIEWTDATWNPIVGCSIISKGCTNCYAMQMAHRIKKMEEGRTGRPDASHYFGTTKVVNGNPVWTGELKPAPENIFTQPLRWKRPRRIFVNSMSDLFHENVPFELIDRVFAVMALTPQHTYQVLTKRSQRMREYLTKIEDRIRNLDCDSRLDQAIGRFPLPNVWLGVSSEDQERADERVPDLLATPAAVRFVSAEPLLGPIDFRTISTGHYFVDATLGFKYHDNPKGTSPTEDCAKLDWVIVGGESGRNARPMHPGWARQIRDQCADAGVAFHFKQWGEWLDADANGADMLGSKHSPLFSFSDGRYVVRVGKKAAGRLLDGVEHNQFPTTAT